MKKFHKLILTPFLISVLLFSNIGTALSFSINEERELGEKLFYSVRTSFDLLDDLDLQQYIDKIGYKVLDVAGVQLFDYHFYVIKNKEFNAFAAPAGLIFFHSGLIEKVADENELLSVMAHEIGHVKKRHLADRISKSKNVTIATIGALLASIALGGGEATEALMIGSVAAGESAKLAFSRENEEEADRIAFDWMIKLNRSPEGQVRMLKTMRRLARYRSGVLPQYLLTHPNPEARLDYVQSLIDAERDSLAELSDELSIPFLRFKYRVMLKARDAMYLRKYFVTVLASTRATELQTIMAKYGLALLEARENNYPEALKLIYEVSSYFKDEYQFGVDKGIIECKSGDLDRGYSTLNGVYDQDRDDMYAAFELAKACLKKGYRKRAEILLKSVMYEVPDYPKVYFELGKFSAEEGKIGETDYYLGKNYLYIGKFAIAKNKLKKASENKELAEELVLDARRSLDLIKKIEK